MVDDCITACTCAKHTSCDMPVLLYLCILIADNCQGQPQSDRNQGHRKCAGRDSLEFLTLHTKFNFF